MKKEHMKLRPFLDIQPGKGRSIFLGNGCGCKSEYTLSSRGKLVCSLLGALVCPFFAKKIPFQVDC
jgi:hypothetical protein